MKRNLPLLALLVFLLSCGKESDEAAPSGSIYKVVIEQQGDFANYNKNLIALTADLQGQGLRFINKETNKRTDIYLKNEDLAAPKITLVPENASHEIEFNFIISPVPVAPAVAGPMSIKFTFFRDDKQIGEKSFSYVDDFTVKQEHLYYK